ncbi:hypothetical protein Pint_29454 [Pistacia integerrima]|uniref:Uncharacterized protein n=1 Tax=Pistacia integerrima TaxID=434235 RepID=A0ACC0WZX9_9ROSI|nr:hypothetical protein Pint_29454 [Pistacia integerrima]
MDWRSSLPLKWNSTSSSNTWDPPSDHVGIDINSMRSRTNVSWLNNVKGGQRNEAWIRYNSSTQNLSVAFTGFKDNATVMQYLDYEIDLRLHLPELVTFGFSGATGVLSANFSVHSWEFNSSLEAANRPPPRLLLVWLAVIRRKRHGDDDVDKHGVSEYMDDEIEMGTGPKRFSYKELAGATNNFNDEHKLGEGGFGGVYKGFLRESNSYIAVKRVSKGSKQGVKEYASEVKIISRLRHRNLVQLLGWCHEKKELLLVYEFMPNGSLDSHLFKENSLLKWEMRYKIAKDLASGLLYLHEEWEQCVVHRDIKSSNWVWELYGSGKLLEAADPRLSEDFDEQQMKVLMIVGLWCAHPDENLRPSIRQATHVLNSEAPLPVLPPNMPVPTYLAPSGNMPISVFSISYGAIYSEGGQNLNQSSVSNHNTNSSQLTSSSGASSSAALLNNTH